MYNRYIPQADGTYRRSRVSDSRPEPITTSKEKTSSEFPEPSNETRNATPIPAEPLTEQQPHQRKNIGKSNSHKQTGGSVNVFLKQLLPQNFDTEDLIIVLLLLLISGDNRDSHNTALLTLVIYLFL